LPLINRAVFDLAFLSPGVTPPAGASFGPNNSANNFISNGSRNATADIIMDGVSTVNYERNSGIQLALYTPSVDAIQEFKVQQLNFSAEIGFSGATVMKRRLPLGHERFSWPCLLLSPQQRVRTNWSRPRRTFARCREAGEAPRPESGQLGVDPSTPARWERGEREPAGAFLSSVKAFLDGGQAESQGNMA